MKLIAMQIREVHIEPFFKLPFRLRNRQPRLIRNDDIPSTAMSRLQDKTIGEFIEIDIVDRIINAKKRNKIISADFFLNVLT